MICNLCKVDKDNDSFYKGRRQCKKCRNEKIKEYKKEYYKNNQDKIKEYIKNNQDKIKENRKEYHKNNKDKIKEYYKEYEKNNQDKRKEYKKEFYKNNKDKIKEYTKEYRKCRSCHLFQTKSKNNYLCSYCSPNSSKRQKTKELQLKNYLEKYYQLIHNKKVNLDNSCQTYFPDFLIDCNSFFICIECDENAHKSYNKNCELIRMNNITYSLGLPTIFLRFNPDKKGIKMKTKQIILKSYIDYYTDKKLSDNVIEYLFY